MQPRFSAVAPDVFCWSDTCNVWVIRDGTAAILIDLGDGSVLDALPEIGVNQIDWVLFTHHHREQCQGHGKLVAWGKDHGPVKLAAPAAERDLFEKPHEFRQLVPKLSDRFTVHGASFVRPPIAPIPLDRVFDKMDTFSWRGRELWCTETAGNSPGSMTYLLWQGRAGEGDTGWLAFSGDFMLADATMHTWFDSEWDYGFCTTRTNSHRFSRLRGRHSTISTRSPGWDSSCSSCT